MITRLLTLVCVALCSHATCQAALIAGWETWSEVAADTWDATQTSGTTAQGVGTVESGGTWSNFTNGTVANGASDDGTYGSLVTGADTAVGASTDGVTLFNGYDGYIDFTVTDTTGTARDLAGFHFDSGAFRPKAALNWELSVVAGDLTPGSVAVGGPVTVAAAPIVDDYDVDLTVLADSTLDANGSVTFRLSFTGGTDGSAGHHLFLDNVGVSDTSVIPEPSSLALLGLLSVAACGRLGRRNG
jgi:hypothetical protein